MPLEQESIDKHASTQTNPLWRALDEASSQGWVIVQLSAAPYETGVWEKTRQP